MPGIVGDMDLVLTYSPDRELGENIRNLAVRPRNSLDGQVEIVAPLAVAVFVQDLYYEALVGVHRKGSIGVVLHREGKDPVTGSAILTHALQQAAGGAQGRAVTQLFDNRVVGVLDLTARQQAGTGHSHSGHGRILQKITPGKSVRHDTFLRLSTKYGVRVSPKQGPQYPGR